MEPQEKVEHNTDNVPRVPLPLVSNGGHVSHQNLAKETADQAERAANMAPERHNVVVVIDERVDIEPEREAQREPPSSRSPSRYPSLSSSGSLVSQLDKPVATAEALSVLQRVSKFDAVEADSKAPYRLRSFDRDDVQQGRTISQRVEHFEQFFAERARCLATKQRSDTDINHTQLFSHDKSSSLTNSPNSLERKA